MVNTDRSNHARHKRQFFAQFAFSLLCTFFFFLFFSRCRLLVTHTDAVLHVMGAELSSDFLVDVITVLNEVRLSEYDEKIAMCI